MIVSGGRPLGFVPQALGETVPFLSDGYFYAQQGLDLAQRFASYAKIYEAQPSVMSLVDKIANSAARIPIKVWQPTESGKLEDSVSPYARLIANPCSTMSRYNFYRWTFSTYEIYGEAYWYKQRGADGKPVNLLPMHPSRTAVHRDDAGNVEYVFTLGVASAGILRAPAEDVVPFLRYNPQNLMRGLSRLEGLRSTLLNEDAARRANASFWNKGARPGTVLTHPEKVSQQVAERLRRQFDSRHTGPDQAGSTVVLEEGMTVQTVQLTAEEMQYIESRKLNMQEACMVYDFPPPAIHILDHATFSNITEQMRSVYRDTMTPRFSDIESVIGQSLRSEFFDDGEREARFDLTEVLRGDFETRADKAVELRNAGAITGNESRELIGLERLDDPEMDKIYANAALAPLGSAKPVATPPATDSKPAAEADQGRASFRSLMGHLARVKGNRPALREKLVELHKQHLGDYFEQQKKAVTSSMLVKDVSTPQMDSAEWNAKLAAVLVALSAATAKSIGQDTADSLGGDYDETDLEDWLNEDAQASAANINATTASEIRTKLAGLVAGDEPMSVVAGLFAGLIAARIAQIAVSRVASVGLQASHAAARQNGGKSKTWVVSGPNPRPSHEAMDGETVGLNELFSNGMRGPGDVSGGADEVAGCTCTLEFTKE